MSLGIVAVLLQLQCALRSRVEVGRRGAVVVVKGQKVEDGNGYEKKTGKVRKRQDNKAAQAGWSLETEVKLTQVLK